MYGDLHRLTNTSDGSKTSHVLKTYEWYRYAMGLDAAWVVKADDDTLWNVPLLLAEARSLAALHQCDTRATLTPHTHLTHTPSLTGMHFTASCAGAGSTLPNTRSAASSSRSGRQTRRHGMWHPPPRSAWARHLARWSGPIRMRTAPLRCSLRRLLAQSSCHGAVQRHPTPHPSVLKHRPTQPHLQAHAYARAVCCRMIPTPTSSLRLFS